DCRMHRRHSHGPRLDLPPPGPPRPNRAAPMTLLVLLAVIAVLLALILALEVQHRRHQGQPTDDEVFTELGRLVRETAERAVAARRTIERIENRKDPEQ